MGSPAKAGRLASRILSAAAALFIAASMLAPLPALPVSGTSGAEAAYAEYMQFGDLITTEKEGENGSEQVEISGGKSLAEGVINGVLRPVTTMMLIASILIFGWRTAYIAIFPMMAGIDPLKMLEDGRYKGATNAARRSTGRNSKSASGSHSKQATASQALAQEAKGMLVGLTIAFAVWSILQLMMLIAVAVISQGGAMVG